jgi:hypothetical protein
MDFEASADALLQQILDWFDDVRNPISMKRAYSFKSRFREDLEAIYRMGEVAEFSRSTEKLERLLLKIQQLPGGNV